MPKTTSNTRADGKREWDRQDIASDRGVMNPLYFETKLANSVIYPEIDTVANVAGITDNLDGTITVDAGTSILWRGHTKYNTDIYSLADRTFSHLASKTYHLRWSPETGLSLEDLSDIEYNPDTLSHTHVDFDTTYDNMLVAKVVTDGGNFPTITPYANAANLYASFTSSGQDTVHEGVFRYSFERTFYPYWGRTPKANVFYGTVSASGVAAIQGGANYYKTINIDRESTYATISTDWDSTPVTPVGNITIQLLG